ncbi:ATP-grasp domain-containing protein [Rhizobium sp.]|jgi:biotin carboxylase|uniref:ATP-grasp domain-containing protein n=1 Tax=Rhizobium sp. TaxID=391 RepID=UPI000E8E06F0|nr:hypothetical protein [Rhizobium sp.]
MIVHMAHRFSAMVDQGTGIRIGVVDPSSGGYFIAKRVLERGFDCVAISSSGELRSDIDFRSTLHASTFDFDNELTRLAFNAIIPGAESGVRLTDDLASRLGLVGNNPKTTSWRRSKTAMARAVRDAGISLCRQARCASLDDADAWAEDIGFPIVVKPEESSGSDLVRVCNNRQELLHHAGMILSGQDKYGQNTHGVLVQEFMSGDEYTVDGVVSQGKLTVFAVGRYRKINRDGAIIYDKIDFFAPHSPTLDTRILPYCEAVTRAVGVNVGPVHIEIMLTPNGPLLVEIAARSHGGIGTSVIDAHFEPSFIDAIIDSYLPEHSDGPALEVSQRKSASIAFLIANRSGTFVSAPGESRIKSLPSFVRLKWFVAPEEDIATTVDLATCPALVELAHEDPAVIEADIRAIRDIESSNEMLEIR